MAQLAPMVEQVEQRWARRPQQWLVDGGFPAHEQIDAVADKTEVYAPVPEARAKKDDAGQRGRAGQAPAQARRQHGRGAVAPAHGQRPRPRSCTSCARPPPSASTRKPGTAACSACRCGAWPRCAASRCCSRWRTTSCARWPWCRNCWAWAQLRLRRAQVLYEEPKPRQNPGLRPLCGFRRGQKPCRDAAVVPGARHRPQSICCWRRPNASQALTRHRRETS